MILSQKKCKVDEQALCLSPLNPALPGSGRPWGCSPLTCHPLRTYFFKTSRCHVREGGQTNNYWAMWLLPGSGHQWCTHNSLPKWWLLSGGCCRDQDELFHAASLMWSAHDVKLWFSVTFCQWISFPFLFKYFYLSFKDV